MKLVDHRETIVLVVPAGLEPEHQDLQSAERLRQEIDARGGGFPYRRAVLTADVSWLDTDVLHGSPVISIGGPGVNLVSRQFTFELITVWSEDDRVVIQADFENGQRRCALWGADRAATAEAVAAFIDKGWLEEFLERCWRFRIGNPA